MSKITNGPEVKRTGILIVVGTFLAFVVFWVGWCMRDLHGK